jgi:hypothetical protein
VQYEIIKEGKNAGCYKVWMSTNNNGLAVFKCVSSATLKESSGKVVLGEKWTRNGWVKPPNSQEFEQSKVLGLLEGSFRDLMDEDCLVCGLSSYC